MHLRKEYQWWMLAESVSQGSMKFWMLSVMICLKENVCLINGEIMFHSAFKKDILKKLFYSVIGSRRLDTNYCQVQGWEILCTFQSQNIPLRSMVMVYISYENNFWKWWKTYFILLHNLVRDFWKKYHKVHVSSPWYMQTPNVSTKHTQIFFTS